jgi:hypothetical protein
LENQKRRKKKKENNLYRWSIGRTWKVLIRFRWARERKETVASYTRRSSSRSTTFEATATKSLTASKGHSSKMINEIRAINLLTSPLCLDRF